MWFTILICIDIFLAWIITSGICFSIFYLSVRIFGLPPTIFEIPFLMMAYVKIPSGFILLARYTPNLLLIGIYFMYSLPKSQAFKCWWGWDYLRKHYFCVTEEDEKKYSDSPKIYAVAPHGSYGEAVIINFTLNPKYKHVITISTSLLFYIPIVREFANLAGAVPASSHHISRELASKNSIVLIPEGLRGIFYPSHEVLRGIPGESDARIGFIRCAMMHKEYTIVPVYCHGQLYKNYNIFPWLQKKILKNYYYPWPMINFGWWGTFWPKRANLKYAFGEEISLINHKTGELRDIMDIHKEYCDVIEKMQKK